MSLLDVTIPTEFEPSPGDRFARPLEEGRILFFRRTPFAISDEDVRFLLAQRQAGGRAHKNIAYRTLSDRVTGVSGRGADAERLRRILGEYSRASLETLARLFPSYARSWHIDYASFRPIEEEGRELSAKARNDRIHVDAFPTRPTRGARILRFFTNIHPEKSREWVSAGTFDRLAERYAESSGLLADVMRRRVPSLGAQAMRAVGLRRQLPTRYDEFMLGFHDFLKACEEVQSSPTRERFTFPPGSSWIVLTDMVSHAVLSGQHALEQTVIIARESLALPEKAPIAILEKLARAPLAPGVPGPA